MNSHWRVTECGHLDFWTSLPWTWHSLQNTCSAKTVRRRDRGYPVGLCRVYCVWTVPCLKYSIAQCFQAKPHFLRPHNRETLSRPVQHECHLLSTRVCEHWRALCGNMCGMYLQPHTETETHTDVFQYCIRYSWPLYIMSGTLDVFLSDRWRIVDDTFIIMLIKK